MVVSQFRRFFNMLMGREAQGNGLPSPQTGKHTDDGVLKGHGRFIEGADKDGKPWYGQEFDSPSWLEEWYRDKVLSKLDS